MADEGVSTAASVLLYIAGAFVLLIALVLLWGLVRMVLAFTKWAGSATGTSKRQQRAEPVAKDEDHAAERSAPSGAKARAMNLKELKRLSKDAAKHKGPVKDDPATHHPQFLNTLKGHGDIVTGVSWSADAGSIATSCEDMSVRVFDVSAGITNNNPKFHSINLTQVPVGVGFGASRQHLAVMHKGIAGQDRLVYYSSADGGGRKWEPVWEVLDVHGRAESMILRSVPQSPSTYPAIVSCSSKKDVRIFGLQGKAMGAAEPNSFANYDLAVSGDGKFLSVASFTADVKIWELKYGRDGYRGCEKVMDLKGHRGAVPSVALSGDGSRGVTVSKDGTMRVWKLDVRYHMNEDPKCLLQAPMPLPSGKCYHRLALWQPSPSQPGVLAAAYEGEIHFLSTATGQPLAPPIPAHSKPITSLLWSPCEVQGADGPVLASSGEDYKVRLWRAPPVVA